MLRATTMTLLVLSDLVLIGWCGVNAADGWVGENGESAALLSLSQSPVRAASQGAGWLLLALLASLPLARLHSATLGLFGLGVGLVCFATGTGTCGSLIRQGGSFKGLIIEALVWGTGLLATVWVYEQLARRHGHPTRPRVRFPTVVLGGGLIVVPLLAIVWLATRSEMKGQALTAVASGAAIGGLMVGLFAGGLRTFMVYSLPMIGAMLAYTIVSWQHGPLSLPEVGTGWTPLAVPLPQDYAAGTVLGMAIGLGWASTFLQPAEDVQTTSSAQGIRIPD